MKSILGQKIGMTQVFTEHGHAIAVTVIKVEPNVVTNVLTKEKNGYDAIQLAIGDQKKSKHKKPAVGHFKKAKTNPKKFVREIRDMNGYHLGETVDVSIFKSGELVDVIGISKGKGFAGAIKRHNQTIGPKSHGGGGGSKPVRQTGSLGEIKSNKVFKGMTMPGHMGHERVTVQNLEVVDVDQENEFILVKGSTPGAKKSFVIIRQAVKGLKSREGVKLVNLAQSIMKNKLLEEAKKHGANVNTDMSVEEMKKAVSAAEKAKEAAKALEEMQEEFSKAAEQQEKLVAELQNVRAELEKATLSHNQEEQTSLQEKVTSLESSIAHFGTKTEEMNAQLEALKNAAEEAIKISEKLQVVVEDISDEKTSDKGGQ